MGQKIPSLTGDGRWKIYHFPAPQGCLNNDAAHGWFTEWPRIRDMARRICLWIYMACSFHFPKVSPPEVWGIKPIASHIHYIPDFCYWNGKVILATDEIASIGGTHWLVSLNQTYGLAILRNSKAGAQKMQPVPST